MNGGIVRVRPVAERVTKPTRSPRSASSAPGHPGPYGGHMTAAGGARHVDERQAARDAVAADLTSAKALTAWIIFGD